MSIWAANNALKVIKEITKTLTFDNTRQLSMLIERLHVEMKILVECDLIGNKKAWKSHPNDDTQRYSYSLSRRQSFISNALRFLCFSIIRADPAGQPNSINAIPHSRKILESELFT